MQVAGETLFQNHILEGQSNLNKSLPVQSNLYHLCSNDSISCDSFLLTLEMRYFRTINRSLEWYLTLLRPLLLKNISMTILRRILRESAFSKHPGKGPEGFRLV